MNECGSVVSVARSSGRHVRVFMVGVGVSNTRMTVPRVWVVCSYCGRRRASLCHSPTGVQLSVDEMPKPDRKRCSYCGFMEMLKGE